MTLCFFLIFFFTSLTAQEGTYKKRVLESIEFDFLTSYYTQTGKNAAVTGGTGSEDLTDFTPTFVLSIPLNDDDVIGLEMGISAYTSASSSNINPFDGSKTASPFNASSGASSSDNYTNFNLSYTHSSDDRNSIWSASITSASEFDYSSFGTGGSYTYLFNQKNSEFSIKGNVFVDKWSLIYPIELRPFTQNGSGINNSLFRRNTITGNANYNPNFNEFDSSNRMTFSMGLGFSQILSQRMQGSIALDVVSQNGLLSTPFQRVYFADVADSFIENFHLADDIEQLPDQRIKIAIGSRLNVYLNEMFVLRSYYRYYSDDWGILSNTFQIEVPIKIVDKYTLYPNFRIYNQSKADYFAPYNAHISTNKFYTSDYDLSKFSATQFGLGIKYTDVFTETGFWKIYLKTLSLEFNAYKRNTGLSSSIITLSSGFVIE